MDPAFDRYEVAFGITRRAEPSRPISFSQRIKRITMLAALSPISEQSMCRGWFSNSGQWLIILSNNKRTSLKLFNLSLLSMCIYLSIWNPHPHIERKYRIKRLLFWNLNAELCYYCNYFGHPITEFTNQEVVDRVLGDANDLLKLIW